MMLSFSLDVDKTDFSMRQHSLLLWTVMLVGGVFGVDEVLVSVMEGDSVMLISNVAEIKNNEELKWKINDNDIIAKIDGETNSSSVPGNQETFKGRLNLNDITGSLTITNILRSDARDYKLQIDSATTEGEPKIFKVTVNEVPVNKDGVRSVSVMKGDSVTLRTGFTQIDAVKWTFQNRDLKPTDDQTGDLTITNISSHQSGNYILETNNISVGLRRTYYVVVIDKKPEVSVKEGKIAVLVTGLKEIQPYDLILNFKGRTIAEIDKNGLHDRKDDRLLLDNFSGYLIISDSATTDTGVYSLTINSSTYSLQRTISVTVSSPDSGVAAGAEAGIVVGLLVFLWCLQL